MDSPHDGLKGVIGAGHMAGGEVKFGDPRWVNKRESSRPGYFPRSRTKAWGANVIRYHSSPGLKCCQLGMGLGQYRLGPDPEGNQSL